MYKEESNDYPQFTDSQWNTIVQAGNGKNPQAVSSLFILSFLFGNVYVSLVDVFSDPNCLLWSGLSLSNVIPTSDPLSYEERHLERLELTVDDKK